MCANMAATRPTAPDLFRCIEVMKREVTEHRGTHPALLERLTLRADELQSSRMALDNAIAEQGDEFIKSGVRRARESCGAASAPAKRRAPQGPPPPPWSLQQSARLPRLLVRSWLGVCSSPLIAACRTKSSYTAAPARSRRAGTACHWAR